MLISKRFLFRCVFRNWNVLPVCCFASLSVYANPSGGTVAQGSAVFSTSGSTLTIQTSDKAFINWQSFNIGLGETTTFVQPSSTSLVWNRINDPNPSQILGNLNANGFVVLQNQSGFYIGGQASIATHGLLMTTAPIPMPDLSGGGPWQFDAPPPTASIINYGQINTAGGSPAFLIAHNIDNEGSITAHGGEIGLYAGKQVLVSERPDGRGLSAAVTLPEGSVDNSGKLIADAGTIAMNAQVVNQGGLVQANSVREVNGVIELVASDSLNLSSSSVISAKGDAQGTSSGGSVTLKSDNQYTDASGSAIDVSGGTHGGNGGQVEISASQISSLQSSIDGSTAAGFVAGKLLLDPLNITLSTSGSSSTPSSGVVIVNPGDPPATGTLTLNVSSFNSLISQGLLSQIDLQASQDINVNALWTLPATSQSQNGQNGSLTLSAGRNITFATGAGIKAGNNWDVDLNAGTALAAGSLPTAGNDGVTLNGTALIQTQNGNINISAANQVTVNTGAIRTLGGGSISVTSQYGDINTGTGTSGYTYNLLASSTYPYYYSVSPSLSGISTAAGGNVTIDAVNGNVISYFPNASTSSTIVKADPGTGAFGPEPGNVTINAGENVYGHYVVADGTGTINAGQNIGSSSQNVALSLIKGSWNLDAPNGNIYLQEVRNPNGVFDHPSSINSPAYHYFDYDPNASVDLTAGIGVYLTGQSLPRNGSSDPVPIIYPPSLDISAGAGGVNLDNSIILFPSPNQNLDITTTGGGALAAVSGTAGISMSDSSQTRYINSEGTFGPTDHASIPPELDNPNPVVLNLSGNMENIDLFTTKETQITVGGDMIDCGFTGQNLHPSDVTFIKVTGQIYNPSSINSVTLSQSIPILPAEDTSSHTVNNWEAVLAAAVNPAKIAAINVPANISPSQYYTLYVAPNLEFGGILSSFAYNQSTGRLSYVGTMDPTVAAALEKPLTVVRYGPDGNPLVINGQIQTETLTWVPASSIQSLAAASQGTPAISAFAGGYVIGGPGQFDISASSLSLGNSLGILSYGAAPDNGSDNGYVNLAPYVKSGGASIDVEVAGNLDMSGSTIAALAGGNVKVNGGGSMDLGSQELVNIENEIVTAHHDLALGIYSTGGGNVDVTAVGDINVDSSRIATFNGGNVTVESFQGNVNAGSGGASAVPVNVYYTDPVTGRPGSYLEFVYANGIVAETLVKSSQVPGGAATPGNITVLTPQGNIAASEGGILQEALNGNLSGGPTVTLTAGSTGHTGNIDLGDSGVIGGTVNVTANGDVTGLVISRQSSTVNAAQNFNGTVLSGGNAGVSAGGSVSGTIIGVSGATVSGGSGVSATVLSQNATVGGTTTSTLGTSATASATSTSAAGTASTDAKEQTIASDASNDDDLKKKKKLPMLTRTISRVTVILPK